MLRYGGHTTCVEVRSHGDRVVVLDAGSGLRRFGRQLFKDGGPKELHLLLTHAHWDHLSGFPYFEPAYQPDYGVVICGGPRPMEFFKNTLTQQMAAPFFPVEISRLKAHIDFGCNCDFANCAAGINGSKGDFHCSSIRLNHPNGGYGFKLTEAGKSFVFIPDNELRFHHEGGLERADYVSFCRGADLLFHDAQYTEEDYTRTQGWGHSTITDTVDLALDAEVKRVGLFHHDPDRTDDQLDRLQAEARSYIHDRGRTLDCFACAEGQTVEL